MSRETKLVKNTLILAIGTFLPKIVSFITLPVLTGYLTKDEYGTYDLILILVSLVLPIATLQIQSAAFRFLIDKRDNREDTDRIITNIYGFVVPVSVVALVIMYFCLYKLSVLTRIYISLYFMGDILVNAARQVARGLARNFDYSISAIISSVCQMVFVIVLVKYFKQGLDGGVLALAVAEFLSIAYLALKIRLFSHFKLSLLSRRYLSEMLAYSWPMVPNSLSMWVMRVSDRVVISLFMGVGANAVYAVANKLPQILTIAQTTFSMAWQENASIASEDDDAGQYYSNMFRTMFDLMVGFMSLLIAVTPLLFIILIRGDYSSAYVHIPILFMAMLFYSLSSFIGGIYVAFKRTTSVGITTIFAAICNLVIDLALINFVGIFAASCSTLASYLILFVYRMLDVRKIIRLSYDYAHIIALLVILVVQCALCMIRNPVIDVINGVVGVIVFIIFNRKLIETVLKKLKKKIA